MGKGRSGGGGGGGERVLKEKEGRWREMLGLPPSWCVSRKFGDSNSGLGLLTRCWLDLSKPTRYFSEGLDSDLCAPSCPLILVL